MAYNMQLGKGGYAVTLFGQLRRIRRGTFGLAQTTVFAATMVKDLPMFQFLLP